MFFAVFRDLLGLALADVIRRGRPVEALDDRAHNMGPGGVCELAKLAEGILDVPTVDTAVLETNEQCFFASGGRIGRHASDPVPIRRRAVSMGSPVEVFKLRLMTGNVNWWRHQVNCLLA